MGERSHVTVRRLRWQPMWRARQRCMLRHFSQSLEWRRQVCGGNGAIREVAAAANGTGKEAEELSKEAVVQQKSPYTYI